jgi:hypothetical protein
VGRAELGVDLWLDEVALKAAEQHAVHHAAAHAGLRDDLGT